MWLERTGQGRDRMNYNTYHTGKNILWLDKTVQDRIGKDRIQHIV